MKITIKDNTGKAVLTTEASTLTEKELIPVISDNINRFITVSGENGNEWTHEITYRTIQTERGLACNDDATVEYHVAEVLAAIKEDFVFDADVPTAEQLRKMGYNAHLISSMSESELRHADGIHDASELENYMDGLAAKYDV